MRRSDLPLNAVERRHSDAILAAGSDPNDWLIESQLATWEQHHGWPLSPEQAVEIRRLSDEAASRFEVAECLQLYSLAEAHIRTMQAMSFDRQGLQPAPFRIATLPGNLVHPHVEAEWHAGLSADEAASGQGPVVWMPVQALNRFDSVTGVISDRLVRHVGDLRSLTAAFDRHLTWDESLDILRRHRLRIRADVATLPSGRRSIVFPNPVDEPPDSADPMVTVNNYLKLMVTTFVAGHEAGHLYLGHFGDRELIDPISGGDGMPPILRREVAADGLGIASVWDGFASNGLSIDSTWPGPVVALAISAGEAAAYPDSDRDTPQDTWEDWVHRLSLAIQTLGQSLIGNGFGLARSGPILASTAPLAACIYEYVRTGGDLADRTGRLGAPGAEVYTYLKETVLPLLEQFGSLDDRPRES